MWQDCESGTAREPEGRAERAAWGTAAGGAGDRRPVQPPRRPSREGVGAWGPGGRVLSFVPSTPGRRQPPGKASTRAELGAQGELGVERGEGAGGGGSLSCSVSERVN